MSPVPQSIWSATVLYSLLGPTIEEKVALKAVLLSITGGADKIEKEKGQADFTIDDTSIRELQAGVKEYTQLEYTQLTEPWKFILENGNYKDAKRRFDQKILIQSPYKTEEKEDEYLYLARNDMVKIAKEENGTNHKPLEKFAKEMFDKVAPYAKIKFIAPTDEGYAPITCLPRKLSLPLPTVKQNIISAIALFSLVRKPEATVEDKDVIKPILLSITGGVDKIRTTEGQADFTIDDTSILEIQATIEKERELSDPWQKIINEGDLKAARDKFDQEILAQSPYTTEKKEGWICLARNDEVDIVNENPKAHSPLQKLARDMFDKVRPGATSKRPSKELGAPIARDFHA